MGENILERLVRLEAAAKRAADTLTRLREENARLSRDLARLTNERRQMLAQIDTVLHDITKLDLR